MADLRINGWSDGSLKCQPVRIKLFDTSGEEPILVSDFSGGEGGGGLWGQALCPSSFAIERAGCFA